MLLAVPGSAAAQGPRNAGDAAWDRGDARGAAGSYLEQVQRGAGGDTAWYNLGTAALALGDSAVARRALARAAASLEPDVRFRALYNLGLFELRMAARDSAGREAHLAQALAHYRDALMLRPDHAWSKWNLELALRRRPPESGGSSGAPPAGGGAPPPEQTPPEALSPEQADQLLNSISEQERQTRLDMMRRRRQSQEVRGRRDW